MSSKPRFVGEKVKLGELLLNTFSGEWGIEEGELLTPVLRTSNFNEDGSLNYSTPAMRCIPEGKVAKKRMVRGDIILEKSGGTPKRPVGIMAFYDSDALALCSNFNQVLRFDESRMLPRFAFHQLRWLKDRNAFDRCTRKTTGLQNLQMKKLIELKLRVPQIEAQTSIATTLDEIVCDQRTLQQEIACLDSLVKSRFVEMFGDPDSNPHGLEVCPLGKVLSVQPSNGMYKPQKDYVSDGSGTPIIRIDSFRSEGPDYSSLKRLNCNESECRRYGINENDIVINRVNSVGCMGKTMLVSHIPEVTVFESNMMRLHSDEAFMIPAFLCAQMTSGFSKSYFEANAKRAIGQASINQKDVKGLPVLVPTIANQKAYLSFVSQVDKSRFIAQQQIEKLQMLYDSLAQDYFGD